MITLNLHKLIDKTILQTIIYQRKTSNYKYWNKDFYDIVICNTVDSLDKYRRKIEYSDMHYLLTLKKYYTHYGNLPKFFKIKDDESIYFQECFLDNFSQFLNLREKHAVIPLNNYDWLKLNELAFFL